MQPCKRNIEATVQSYMSWLNMGDRYTECDQNDDAVSWLNIYSVCALGVKDRAMEQQVQNLCQQRLKGRKPTCKASRVPCIASGCILFRNFTPVNKVCSNRGFFMYKIRHL